MCVCGNTQQESLMTAGKVRERLLFWDPTEIFKEIKQNVPAKCKQLQNSPQKSFPGSTEALDPRETTHR